ERPASLEQTGLLDAALRVVDEFQELTAALITTGRAEHGELIELCDAVAAAGSGRRSSARRGVGRDAGPLAVAERNLRERRLVGVGSVALERRGAQDVERSLRVRRGGRITEIRVARLISEVSWNRDRADRHRGRELQLNADQKLALEYRERQILAGLLQVRRWRKDDLFDRHAGGS